MVEKSISRMLRESDRKGREQRKKILEDKGVGEGTEQKLLVQIKRQGKQVGPTFGDRVWSHSSRSKTCVYASYFVLPSE